MKKIIILFLMYHSLITGYAASGNTVSENCSYKSEFEQCKSENKNGNPRSIEDFVCISSENDIEIMSQIILDKKFKKLDKEVDTFMKQLEDNKTKYFGKSASNTIIEGIDEVENKLGIYNDDSLGKKYYDACKPSEKGSVISETIDCFGGSIPETDTKNYFLETDCKKLTLTKLEISKQVSYDILKLNKHQVRNDEKKTYQSEQRGKYDKLLEIIMVNIGYMERIWKKWPSKTKQADGK